MPGGEGDKVAVFARGNHAFALTVLDDPPEDDDFVGTPPDGAVVVADGKLYVRIDGTWEPFTPDV